jgi:hypothetical protein
MHVLATTDGGFYKTVLVLHVLCAIVGFGAVMLNALYGNEVRKRPGPDGLAVFDANFRVSKVADGFIYAVFVLGILLVLLSDDAWEFDQTWVWAAMLLFLAAVALSHGVLRPTLHRMRVLMVELGSGPPPGTPDGGSGASPPAGPPPQALELASLGKRLGVVGPTLNLAVVVILALMIWKPGA